MPPVGVGWEVIEEAASGSNKVEVARAIEKGEQTRSSGCNHVMC